MLSLQRHLLGILVLAVMLAPATAAAQVASQSIEVALSSALPLAGANLDFTITANNEGPDSAANAAVTFGVTTPATFVSRSVPAGWSCSTLTPGTTGMISCTIASFPPGSVSFTLTVTTTPSTPQGTPVTVPASITSTTSDPDSNDNSAALTVLLVWQSNLSVAKSGPASAFTGAQLVYTIAISNPGPSNAADVVVTDTFAAPLRFVSIVAAGWSCVTPAVGSPGTVSCSKAEIPVGTTNLTLTLDTAPSTAPTNVTNDVSVSAASDPAGPRVSSATTALTASADLTIAKSAAPPTPVAGQAITYTLTITQNGPSDAAGVTVSDPLPGSVRFQSVTAPLWSCATPAVGSSGTVSCTRTSLPPGVHVITIQGLVPASTPSGTVISNTASATAATPDPTLPNTATASAAASAQADLAVTITDSPDPVSPLATLTYQVVVSNGGPSDANNPNLSVPLDPALRFVSLTSPGGWTCTTPPVGSVGTVSCQAASLASGASATFTIVATVFPTGGSSQTASTRAATVSGVTDPNLNNNSATATTAVTASSGIPTLSNFLFLVMAGLLVLVAVLRLRTGGSRPA